MLNSPRLSCVRTVLLCLLAVTAAATAHGQATPPQSTLDRVLSRMDFGVSGVGQFTGTVSGTNYLGVNVSQSASNTLGALVTVRYTKSPYKGFEFNYSYARYTENFSAYLAGGAQTNATEYTLGYVAHPPHQVLGFNPFLSGGLGLIEFKPTASGGRGLQNQGALGYYYAAGLERSVISPHFGVRAQVRQIFFLAPDFYQNYLTTEQHTYTFEPGFGFYLKF